MKKAISILLVILILIVCGIEVGIAEDFSIRNGIKFGMSMDEVAEIEEANNSIVEKSEYSVSATANVAGFDDCHIYYGFTDNQLVSISYNWGHYYGSDYSELEKFFSDSNEKYDVIEKHLSEKYKQIGYIDNGKIIYIPFGNEYDLLCITSQNNGNYDVHGFKQYLANDGSDYVDILICSYTRDTKDGFGFKVLSGDFQVKYNFIPKEEYDSVVNEINDLQNKIDSDL